VLELEDVLKPRPERDEVLIKVHAVSVNPVDFKLRSGAFKPPGTVPPLTLGRDVSGVVESVGTGVTQVKPGDEVYALLDFAHGGYAEYAIAPAAGTARKPRTLDHTGAAAVPLAATTAWQGLIDHGHLQAGERVLIHGAAGGVGLFALQFAKVRGAYAIVTAAREDTKLLRDLGADEVIDYQKTRFEDAVHDVDLVFDLIGGDTQRRSWAVIKDGGRMVSTLTPPSPQEAAKRHAQAAHFMAKPDARQLQEFTRLIDAGKVLVVVQETLLLEDVQRAHEKLEHGHTRGKIVLEVQEA
jgi:NADPH:quinone reductase-like Zn-dependent oxidoreductase